MKKYLIYILLILLPICAENLKRTRLAQQQLTPTNTSIYSPPTGKSAVIQNIMICNTSSSTKYVWLYMDNTGTTYDKTTAFFYEVSLSAYETKMIDTSQDSGLYITNENGNFAGECNVSNSVTVTAWGYEVYYG